MLMINVTLALKYQLLRTLKKKVYRGSQILKMASMSFCTGLARSMAGKNVITFHAVLYFNFKVASATPLAETNITDIDTQIELSTENLFNWEDYSVLATMLIISCTIGIFYGYFGKQQTTDDDFLLGGSSMGTFPMALSLAASFITAVELLGNPAEMYMVGAQFWMICLAFVLVVPIASNLYLPVFMKLRLTSCYEYLEVRFCKSVRVYASTLYFVQMILYSAVAVYAPALALSDVTGLNTYLAVSLIYLVCIFYASQGGMKAVMMTDIFQSAVLIGSLGIVLGMGAEQVGGFNDVWDNAWRTHRLHLFDMNPDPTVRHSFWSVVIGGIMYWTSMFCANQASVQKYLSVKRIEQARLSLWVSAFGLITVYSINFVTGAILALYYADCDPIQAGVVNGPDRLLPLFVVRQLGRSRGVPGFFVAGIFAASLGTVAAALNSLAAIVCQDLVTGLLGISLPESKGALIARWVCVACGVMSFALVFAIERMGPVLQLALSFNGMTGGVALGLFSLGMFFPWANSKGAIAGGVVGLLLVAAAGGGAQFAQLPLPRVPSSIDGCTTIQNLTTYATSENEEEAVFWLFRVSYLWYSGLGCAATLVAGLIVSIITGTSDPDNVPIDLISPPVVTMLNSLPKRMKKALKISSRIGYERRCSLRARPVSIAVEKDVQRQSRLTEMASGVLFCDAPALTRGYDNFALRMEPEKHSLDDCCTKRNSIVLEITINNNPETSNC